MKAIRVEVLCAAWTVFCAASSLAQSAPDRIWVASGHTLAAYATAFSPDGTILVSGSYDKTVKLWQASDGSLVRTLTGHSGSVGTVAFSSDGSTIASGSADLSIKLWRASDGSLIRTLTGHTANVRSVAFSPDGSLLVSGAQDNTVRLWRVSDGVLLRTLTGHGNWVASVAFSPDGGSVASASYDRTARVWRVSDGALLSTLNHNSYVFSVAFSPDGTTLASGSADLTVRLWRVSDGSLTRTLSGFTDWVWSAAFSPDGNTMITADNDAVIKLWKLSDGSLLQTYQEVALVTKIGFSPDGTKFGYGRADYMVVLANNPANGSTSSLMNLDVLASTDKSSYVNRDTATIFVSVTDGVNPVPGANVTATVSAPKGSQSNLSGTSGANGVAIFSYKVNSKLGTGIYSVNACATKAGCNPGTDPITFTVTR